MGCADATEARTLDLEMQVRGRFNAVVWWYDVRLYGDVRMVTHAPLAPRQPDRQQDAECGGRDPAAQDEHDGYDEGTGAGGDDVGCGVEAAAPAPGALALVVVAASSRPASRCAVRPRSLQAAVHWLPGPIRVQAGDVLPVSVCHNTVAMRFEVRTVVNACMSE